MTPLPRLAQGSRSTKPDWATNQQTTIAFNEHCIAASSHFQAHQQWRQYPLLDRRVGQRASLLWLKNQRMSSVSSRRIKMKNSRPLPQRVLASQLEDKRQQMSIHLQKSQLGQGEQRRVKGSSPARSSTPRKALLRMSLHRRRRKHLRASGRAQLHHEVDDHQLCLHCRRQRLQSLPTLPTLSTDKVSH